MRKAGTKDPKKDCIRYMARLSRPEMYNADAPRFGMPEWEYSQYEAIYDNASTATELLSDKGALEYRHCDFVPDYWAELPEDKAPKGRVLLPKGARETMSDGGEVAVRTMSEAAKRDGVDIRTGHRVQRVIRNSKGEIIGVEADSAKGKKRFWRGRPSFSAPAASPTMWSCGRTISVHRFMAVAPRSAMKATSSTSPARSARSSAT